MADVPEEFEPAVRAFVDYFPAKVDDYEKLLSNNPLWLDRTQNVGFISAQDAIALGCTGPTLRGSGVNWDIRRRAYSGYEQFDFEVPLGQHGDVYDRYIIRVEEMRQSLRIVKQAIDNLPGGAFRSNNRKYVPPPRAELGRSMEAVIHHFKLWTEGFRPPKGEVYVRVESPRGSWGVSGERWQPEPWRVHFRTPSFVHLSAPPHMAKGHLIADLVGIIGSIDIVLGDCDR